MGLGDECDDTGLEQPALAGAVPVAEWVVDGITGPEHTGECSALRQKWTEAYGNSVDGEVGSDDLHHGAGQCDDLPRNRSSAQREGAPPCGEVAANLPTADHRAEPREEVSPHLPSAHGLGLPG